MPDIAFVSSYLPDLPKLAWVIDVGPEGVARLAHGSAVEVTERFFVEGAWNGRFSEGAFGRTECMFGTGGLIEGDSLLLVSSVSTTDFLYYRETGRHVTASNSLPLLLARIGDCLDRSFDRYGSICLSILEGINDYERVIPTSRGAVRRLTHRNLRVSSTCVVEIEKEMPSAFRNFAEYRDYLSSCCEQLASNIRDPGRAHPASICSTQSSGYDSTAINCIAGRFGIDKVFTLLKSKSPRHLANHENEEREQEDDDGTEICRILGLKQVPIDRRAFARDFQDEYLYYAAIHDIQDVNFKEVLGHVSGVTFLLTGKLGGELWYTESSQKRMPRFPDLVDSTLKAGDLSCHGLSELRLAVGLIQVPLAYLGARRAEEIMRITESREMQAWRLGLFYDRPVPRRIAEEQGIPRKAFGHVKRGSVVLFPYPPLPYGRKLRAEFLHYLRQTGVAGTVRSWLWPAVQFVNQVIAFYSEDRYRAVYYFERIVARLIRDPSFRFTRIWTAQDGALYCFCVNKRAAELTDVLRRSVPERSRRPERTAVA